MEVSAFLEARGKAVVVGLGEFEGICRRFGEEVREDCELGVDEDAGEGEDGEREVDAELATAGFGDWQGAGAHCVNEDWYNRIELWE